MCVYNSIYKYMPYATKILYINDLIKHFNYKFMHFIIIVIIIYLFFVIHISFRGYK